MNYAAIAMAVAGLAFFVKAGIQEMESGVLWGGLSLVVSAFILIPMGGGVLAVFLGQVGLLAAITLFRMVFDKDGAP